MNIFGNEPFRWREMTRGTARSVGVVTGAALVSLALLAASAGAAPLPGSSFDAANGTLTDLVDHDWNPAGQPAGNIGPLQEIICPALGAGTNCGVDRTNSSLDDSFTQGPKEDDPAPVVGTGSIPPNKDDLERFYVNQEKAGGDDFLYLAWERTNTLGSAHMDFEFNQSNANSANGVTKVRTAGDILITFDFGGSGQPVLSLSRWITTGATSLCEASNSLPCWSDLVNLTTGGLANGAVNNTNVIDFNPPNAPRTLAGSVANNGSVSSTFGEAAINLTDAQVFPPNRCFHLGAANLKSRSSGQSFTSSLKDFIAPIPVNITNCGQVIIRKVTDPASDPDTVKFGYTKSFTTDPVTPNTFQLGHGQSQSFDGVLPGSGYTVTEDVLPMGWDFVSVDCTASTGVTPTINGATVTFAIDDPADILDCTYTNKARATLIVEKITDDGFGSFVFTSLTQPIPATFTLTTTAAGDAGKDSETFGNLLPGTYGVAETVPAGWNLVSATCSDGSMPGSVMLSAGETVTCTFHDARQTGAIEIAKTRKHAAGGSGDQPHAGVTFTITGGELPAAGVTAVTDANGVACVDGLLVSSLAGGDYTVTETVPSGYVSDDSVKTVAVTAESDCGDGNEATVSFHNTPLTNVTVSVDSQVDGGTASAIDCGPGHTGSTGANGDGSVTVPDLEPTAPAVTLTCTITVDP